MENMRNTEACYQGQIMEKFVWNSGNDQMLTRLMCRGQTCAKLDRAIDMIDRDIDEALNLLIVALKKRPNV